MTNKTRSLASCWHFAFLCCVFAKVWPDVLKKHGGNADWLWTHEWEKHGTCATPVLDGEHAYFSKALELYGMLNPTPTLEHNHIYPSDSAWYVFEDVESAIRQSFGASVSIGCQNGGKDLFQIEFCVDKNFQPRECGGKDNTNCESTIRLPKVN
mmetsp:Transcript_7966/g.19660  ORF Transcript_7966/g.19660 Transcript_7966/m.19660 type:complete len:154 (-) Transcript_7966:42-503(-)